MSINDFCHFWTFHYNGKNWRLTTFWGLFVALKSYTFLKKIVQSLIEPKLKIETIFLIKDRLRMQKSLIVRHLILGVQWKICLINNHVKQIFTDLLTTDLWLSSI